jgi:hypothetical protein
MYPLSAHSQQRTGWRAIGSPIQWEPVSGRANQAGQHQGVAGGVKVGGDRRFPLARSEAYVGELALCNPEPPSMYCRSWARGNWRRWYAAMLIFRVSIWRSTSSGSRRFAWWGVRALRISYAQWEGSPAELRKSLRNLARPARIERATYGFGGHCDRARHSNPQFRAFRSSSRCLANWNSV